MATIVYCSNTGSAKRYAELLSEKTGIPCIDISDRATLPADEEVIFIGWIMAGALQGLKEIRESFKSVKAICGVGMMKSEKSTEEVKEKNGITDVEKYLKTYIDNYNRTAVPYKKISILKVRKDEFPKNTLRKIMRFKLDMSID